MLGIGSGNSKTEILCEDDPSDKILSSTVWPVPITIELPTVEIEPAPITIESFSFSDLDQL